MSRIGIRMLIGQHIALNMAQNSPTKQRLSSLINGSQGTTKSHVQIMLVSFVLIVMSGRLLKMLLKLPNTFAKNIMGYSKPQKYS